MFFHTLRVAWRFFPRKYSTFSQQIATVSLQKHSQISQINKAFRRSTLLAIGDCAPVFYIARAMIGKEKKRPASIYSAAKQLSFPCFHFENG